MGSLEILSALSLIRLEACVKHWNKNHKIDEWTTKLIFSLFIYWQSHLVPFDPGASLVRY